MSKKPPNSIRTSREGTKSRRELFRISGSNTREKDKSVKIPLEPRKLKDSRIKMSPLMPNIEELLTQVSTGRSRVRNEAMWMSQIDLEYAYSQLKLSEETSKHSNFVTTGRNMNGYYRFKRILQSIRYPDNNPRKNRKINKSLDTHVTR